MNAYRASLCHASEPSPQAFKNLSKGLSELADTADSFASKTIPGLLRTAPNLTQNLKHVKAMFQTPEDSKLRPISASSWILTNSL